MIVVGRRSALLLVAGDLVAFVAALYLTLLVRYLTPPTAATLRPYILPFALLFALGLAVFWLAGLYGKRLALFPSRVPDVLLGAQIANVVLAAVFFFALPVFGITPKTILAIYLVISLALVYLWRLALYPRISTPRAQEPVAVVGEGAERDELVREVNGNPRYGIEVVATLAEHDAAAAPAGVPLVAFEDLYEEVFDRVPLSRLADVWFERNVRRDDPVYYAIGKRALDLLGGVLMGFATLVLIPFVWVANRLEGPGPLFLRQERFGKLGVPITVYKFRSMMRDDAASRQWVGEGTNRVTKVGAFLRATSLDEFPQFINILKGELSLVGPRSDIKGLGERLAKELPYYEARYLATPGVTGWAQINQQYEPGNLSPQSVEETKVRLAYDFYYLKHRSLGLDLVIAAKTVKRMLFRLSSAA
ncbi:MAG: sugar transferase [Patescibacteria group bacterium]|nr:sugar transferase [Patescibacteria group bacterium]MDE1944151.1 sugar transferase [Patescibacteria group bacterium]MDE1945240.1 sugar transferase [Patescibacteria group bacterium]MDE2057951.1 sugar transferase [Patescibacteria group bacterium]